MTQISYHRMSMIKVIKFRGLRGACKGRNFDDAQLGAGSTQNAQIFGEGYHIDIMSLEIFKEMHDLRVHYLVRKCMTFMSITWLGNARPSCPSLG